MGRLAGTPGAPLQDPVHSIAATDDLDRLNPVTARLVEHAQSALEHLYARGFNYGQCHALALGRRDAGESLVPSDLEALIDLELAFDAWTHTDFRRPPETHLDVVGVLRRLGGRPSVIAGRPTPVGRDIDRRHRRAVDGLPLRMAPPSWS